MIFGQSGYSIRVEWGRKGARDAAGRGDIVIVVDVLSFSSTVVTALHHGCSIYPYPPHLDGKLYAEKIGGEYILGRAEAAKISRATLSPVSFNSTHKGRKFVLTSLNGAFCTWVAEQVPALLIGSFLNLSSVAKVANNIKQETRSAITVIPCGEQWNDSREHEDSLRPSIEDYLAAGAIVSLLEGEKSPEALVCEGAYSQQRDNISNLIWESGSGRELREKGFEADVTHCSRIDVYTEVPLLRNGHFTTQKTL
ncbi:2-phosphosulfolactate phosphatase [Bacillus sp. FJAT-27225]|uniref:2-phosphosulfolactate phosphatase n=1 Tax=Bacillus sp. FJAT-27225 TaxID=1743144 RepID=UPI00080C2379|nr:2-phosphosulfolactate phosphatase [Bacillus sp. FJAT-27225]OCA87524.1 2-phosphosulfolactate phosphatase [Bacillus sp. FJAT-27225]